MRNVQLAERLLSLLISRERAASMAGDLVEEAGTHGRVWFWTAVLRTAWSLTWRDLAENPLRMLLLAILGYALQLAFTVLGIFVFAFGAFAAGFAAIAIGLVDGAHPPTWLVQTPGTLPSGPLQIAAMTVGFAAVVLSQFQVGRMLAKRSPGHELAPCVAMAMLSGPVDFGFIVLLGGMQSAVVNVGYQALLLLPVYAPLFAGAIRIRNRRMVS